MRTPPTPTPRPLAELVTPRAAGLLRGSAPDAAVAGIACDSRVVASGDLFVAVAVLRSDARAFVAEAAARGAVAAVVESVSSDHVPSPLPLLAVSDSRVMLAELAAAWFAEPARAVPLVGITGTLATTSTLRQLETLLAAAGHPGRLPRRAAPPRAHVRRGGHAGRCAARGSGGGPARRPAPPPGQPGDGRRVGAGAAVDRGGRVPGPARLTGTVSRGPRTRWA
jgi:hypothetical protein